MKSRHQRMNLPITAAATAASLLLLLPSPSHGWLLPVSSPIMSLPVIEATPQHPSATFPFALSMPPLTTHTGTHTHTHTGTHTDTDTIVMDCEADKKHEMRQWSSDQAKQQTSFKVFCDLDGVLVDFEHGIKQLFPPDTKFLPQLADLEKSTMWKSVREADAFFEHLPWTKEGRDLWMAIQHLQPDILTGVPIHPSSRMEKYRWCLRELGGLTNLPMHHVDMACPWTHGHRPLNTGTANQWLDSDHMSTESSEAKVCRVITCWSSNKHYESGPGHVLIDDRESLREAWERKGGIFIHHQPGNLQGTLEQLQRHGLLLAA